MIIAINGPSTSAVAQIVGQLASDLNRSLQADVFRMPLWKKQFMTGKWVRDKIASIANASHVIVLLDGAEGGRFRSQLGAAAALLSGADQSVKVSVILLNREAANRTGYKLPLFHQFCLRTVVNYSAVYRIEMPGERPSNLAAIISRFMGVDDGAVHVKASQPEAVGSAADLQSGLADLDLVIQLAEADSSLVAAHARELALLSLLDTAKQARSQRDVGVQCQRTPARVTRPTQTQPEAPVLGVDVGVQAQGRRASLASGLSDSEDRKQVCDLYRAQYAALLSEAIMLITHREASVVCSSGKTFSQQIAAILNNALTTGVVPFQARLELRAALLELLKSLKPSQSAGATAESFHRLQLTYTSLVKELGMRDEDPIYDHDYYDQQRTQACYEVMRELDLDSLLSAQSGAANDTLSKHGRLISAAAGR